MVMIILILFSVLVSKMCNGSPIDVTSDLREIKENINFIKRQLPENLNLRPLEQNLIQIQNTLTSIDTNVKNLQERAHVWDTFQLHVSAWNDQLSAADRKLDILSKGQEKIYNLDAKLNVIPNTEFKIDHLFHKVAAINGYLQEMSSKLDDKRQDQNLFGEFTTRGILSTLKQIEQKVDKLSVNGRNIKKPAGRSGRCEVDDVLKDVSSKIDVIFDKFSEKDEEVEEGYYEDQSSDESGSKKQDLDAKLLRKVLKLLKESCKKTTKVLENVLIKAENIEGDTRSDLKGSSEIQEVNNNTNGGNEHRKRIQDEIDKYRAKYPNRSIDSFETTTYSFEEMSTTEEITIHPPYSEPFDYTYCFTMQNLSGVISFLKENLNSAGRDYNTRACENGWTIIQTRSDYSEQENFNRTWDDYKMGFGELNKDFWFGNDFIHKLSSENDLILRVELENFSEVKVWAEYDVFKISDEFDFYKLHVGGFTGTASDSFSSHNMSKFSTYDRKNDLAPSCCPCALAYGSGWWFDSCFESNLNGIYYTHPYTNEYYKGIIWEHWLGNYSLKRARMMVKPKGAVRFRENIELTPVYIEDP